MKRSFKNAALVAALGVALPTLASAFSSGIVDQAQAGCSCHGLLPNAPSTRVFILGLPDGSNPLGPKGYASGQSYDIQVIVLGVAEPSPRAAGFNLFPSAGDLQATDGTARVEHKTECTVMAKQIGCTTGSTANDCTIVDDPGCPAPQWNVANSACRQCPTGGTNCRPCDATTVLDVQATHSAPSPFLWKLRWTAPPAGTGTVKFYLAGNVVNGNGSPDSGDLWSTLGSDPLQPVITVPEGETPGLLPSLPSYP